MPKKTKKNSKQKIEIKKEEIKQFNIAEAIAEAKKAHKAKFDASIEVHFRLGIDPKKGEQQVRSAVSLPHGTGKIVRVAAFVSPDKISECQKAGADFAGGEELIAEIKKSEKTDFEVAVAEPLMMPKLAQIAKILGTRGLMPSPKNETVTLDPAKAISELKKGKVSFKNDNTGNVHVVIGKISFEDKKLIENYQVLLDTIQKSKPSSSKGIYIKNISICSSMGPGIKIAL